MKRPALWTVGITIGLAGACIVYIYGSYQRLVQQGAELHPPLDVRDRFNSNAAKRYDNVVWLLELAMGMSWLRRRVASRLEVSKQDLILWKMPVWQEELIFY